MGFYSLILGGSKMVKLNRFPEGKKKAFTASYDDGAIQDLRLIELFKKYKIKATFNLNSGLFGKTQSFQIGRAHV